MRRSAYFKKHEPFFKDAYARNWEYLAGINIHFINYLTDALGINARVIRSSALGIRGKKTARLVEICKNLGADTYLSGKGARAYLDLERFREQGIEVLFQDFKHPVYKQVYNNFEPFMSVVDLLFNRGDESLGILRGGV